MNGMTESVNTNTRNTLPSAEDVFLADSADSSNTQPTLLICSIHENERPLKGSAGALDWRLRGVLSKFVIAGRISGSQDEIIYIPIRHRDSVRHLLLVGLGQSKDGATTDESESHATTAALKKAVKTVRSLGFRKVAVSKSSFAELTDARIRKAFDDIEVEFTQ